MSTQPYMGRLLPTSLPPRLRELCGKRDRKNVRTRGLGGVLWNSVFFWTVCGYWLMNSQQLWLSTRDPHMLKFQHGRGKGSGGLRPRLRSCWQLMSTGDNTVIFLWGWTTSRLYTPQLWHHNHAHMGSSNWNQWVIFLKKIKKKERKITWSWEGDV